MKSVSWPFGGTPKISEQVPAHLLPEQARAQTAPGIRRHNPHTITVVPNALFLMARNLQILLHGFKARLIFS